MNKLSSTELKALIAAIFGIIIAIVLMTDANNTLARTIVGGIIFLCIGLIAIAVDPTSK